MSNKPPPLPLDKKKPEEPPANHNRWWKVLLRIGAGAILAAGSTWSGYALGEAIHFPFLHLVAPALVFAALVFVSIRFRRFGYVTGFVLAPFIIVAVVVVLLLIYCGVHGWKA